MKTRIDRILLAALLTSAVLYALVWAAFLFLDTESELLRTLALWSHAVPAFCLQLLLCRNIKRVAPRLLPLLVALLASAFCLWKLAGAEGWDSLGWLYPLILTLAPLVGVVLGWLVYGIGWLKEHAASKRSA